MADRWRLMKMRVQLKQANRRKLPQTAANRRKPPQTAANHRKPPQTTTNRRKSPQTFNKHIRGKKQSIANRRKPKGVLRLS